MGIGVVTGMEERLHAKSKSPAGLRRRMGGGFSIARPNPACDDGFKGPLTKPQTDGSRRTALGAKIGCQRAANLDLDPILILGS
jgi:hypothetical protein